MPVPILDRVTPILDRLTPILDRVTPMNRFGGSSLHSRFIGADEKMAHPTARRRCPRSIGRGRLLAPANIWHCSRFGFNPSHKLRGHAGSHNPVAIQNGERFSSGAWNRHAGSRCDHIQPIAHNVRQHKHHQTPGMASPREASRFHRAGRLAHRVEFLDRCACCR